MAVAKCFVREISSVGIVLRGAASSIDSKTQQFFQIVTFLVFHLTLFRENEGATRFYLQNHKQNFDPKF